MGMAFSGNVSGGGISCISDIFAVEKQFSIPKDGLVVKSWGLFGNYEI
jgi:hypothetical protein